MPEMTATVPYTWVSGTVRSAFEEFPTTLPTGRGFRCRACQKSYVVMSETEIPAHECTGIYARDGSGLPVTSL